MGCWSITISLDYCYGPYILNVWRSLTCVLIYSFHGNDVITVHNCNQVLTLHRSSILPKAPVLDPH